MNHKNLLAKVSRDITSDVLPIFVSKFKFLYHRQPNSFDKISVQVIFRMNENDSVNDLSQKFS